MSDKLKPVKCGCGGEAEVKSNNTQYFKRYWVDCTVCKIGTEWCGTEAEAITSWNVAMSGNVQECAKDARYTERTAKVVEGQKGSYYCTGCGKWCDKGEDIYCAHCGARLEWE